MYKCICGKEFTNKKSLTSHRARCKQFHLVNDQKKFIDNWISEKHKCEHCGKVMTSYFGSGRFCCRACANSRERSQEVKDAISKKLSGKICCSNSNGEVIYIHLNDPIPKGYIKGNFSLVKDMSFEEFAYSKNIDNYKCVVCGSNLSSNQRNTCSEKCYRELLSKRISESIVRNGGNNSYKRGFDYGSCKYGTYQGIECDSSYELAFVIYCLDNGIEVKRNTEYFKYTIDGETHNYFPDFIVGNVYIEIKGYLDKISLEKYNQFPMDKYIVIIHNDKMNRFLNYCIDAYGTDYTKMYDDDKPHWKYK